MVRQLIDDADRHPDDAALTARANAVKATIHIENVSRYRYTQDPTRRGTTDESGCAMVDCSALMNATVGSYYQLPNTAGEMYSYFKTHGGLLSESQAKPGDLIFFRNHLNKDLVQHVGQTLGNSRFVHITATHEGRIRTTRLTDLRSPSNSPADQQYVYADDVVGYGSLDALPRRDAQAVARKLAPTGEKTIRFGAADPGGVYISPDLVAEAASMSGSEILDEITSAIDHMDFKKAPVQEIDAPQVQDY
jgi:cell wall-associated NlpC family hydrolase